MRRRRFKKSGSGKRAHVSKIMKQMELIINNPISVVLALPRPDSTTTKTRNKGYPMAMAREGFFFYRFFFFRKKYSRFLFPFFPFSPILDTICKRIMECPVLTISHWRKRSQRREVTYSKSPRMVREITIRTKQPYPSPQSKQKQVLVSAVWPRGVAGKKITFCERPKTPPHRIQVAR